MSVQWYPGHMHKAGKEIKKALPGVDIVIEVLDARIPFSSENPLIAQLRGEKPCIKVLNKDDLADPEITAQWQGYLDQQKGIKTLAVNKQQPDRIRQLTELCRKLVPNKQDKTLFAMIAGIPNVGKSTLINILAGRTIAKTGNEPAVTKGQQRIQLENRIVLWDTPGMLWPNLEHPSTGYRLATTGAIKDTAIEHEDIALFAAGYLMEVYPQRLVDRYQLEALPASESELLETIGKKRGNLRSGGFVDYDKVSKALLNELRNGSLGRLSFETPQMMEKELVELEAIRAEKKAKKEARKQRWKSGKSI